MVGKKGPVIGGRRPDINIQRNTVINQKNVDIRNRIQNNQTNINRWGNRWGNPNVVRNLATQRRPWNLQDNRVTGIQRQWNGRNQNFGPRGNFHYHDYWSNVHRRWANHRWNWHRRPWLWAGAGYGLGWWSSLTPYRYVNPFYVAPAQPILVDIPAIDYSRPIVDVEQITSQTWQAPSIDSAEIQAGVNLLDQARDAFRNGDYASARRLAEEALKKTPQDPVLHEFRALTLFALQEYRDAAAAIYAVLSVGPGMSWESIGELYANSEVYTRQLRLLEDFHTRNQRSTDAMFLLAYHYTVLDLPDLAGKMLAKLREELPQDPLVQQLQQSLEEESDEPSSDQVQAAQKLFEEARGLFSQRRYEDARQKIDEALGQVSSDVSLNEFRALVYFAQRRYEDAAGILYPVLGAGPPWSVATLKSFYQDLNLHARQVQALEEYVEVNPRDHDALFLLGYHQFLQGRMQDAARTWTQASGLVQDDEVLPRLIELTKNPNS